MQVNFKNINLCGNSLLEIGSFSIVNSSLSCQKNGAELKIGEKCFLGVRTIVLSTSRIFIGNNVLISHNCYITDTDGHPINYKLRMFDVPNRWKGYKDWSNVISSPIYIEDDAWIGPNSIILKGVRIGRGSIIAAGSVVTTNVEPFTIVSGVPAVTVKCIKDFL
jgi:acetyltransferase-like isoleucine patch superfamily enzyme